MNKKATIRTAHHEAGHVVAAVAAGICVGEVTIRPTRQAHGSAVVANVLDPDHWATEHGRPPRRWVEDRVIGLLAGGAAERVLAPGIDAFQGSDVRMASAAIVEFATPRGCSSVGDEVFRAYLDRLRLRAERLVRREWRSVAAVAEALLASRTLSGSMAESIARSTLRDQASPEMRTNS